MEAKSSNQGVKMLAAGATLQLFLGIIYVWSVFVMPINAHFGWDAAAVKLTSSYMLSFFVLGILIGGKLQAKIGTQPVVLAGGLFMAAGMLGASFANALWVVYAAYGIVGGFGVGMAYNAVISCAQKWFPKKRGLATGISVCAFGFSTVIFAPLVSAMVGEGSLGVPMTLRILSALFAVATLALFMFIKQPPEGAAGSPSAELLKKRQYTTSEILRTKEFYFITLSMMLGTAAYFVLNPSFITLAVERGLDATIGTAIVMMTGIANALGRLCIPLLSDKIGREKAGFLILAATAVCAAVLCFGQGFVFMAAVAVIAFCYGGTSGNYPLLTADYFGVKNVGSNYGAIMVGFALSALFFPMLIGLIGDVVVKFIVLAIFAAIGSGFVLSLLSLRKRDE